jgi:hypothetical protein
MGQNLGAKFLVVIVGNRTDICKWRSQITIVRKIGGRATSPASDVQVGRVAGRCSSCSAPPSLPAWSALGGLVTYPASRAIRIQTYR